MMRARTTLLLFATTFAMTALWMGAASAAQSCPVAAIDWPARGATLVEARPEIAWQAVPGVTRYRVQVESRAAEGALLARADTLVSAHRFVPPFPLAEDGRASVKALVTAPCPDGPSVGLESAHFFIDLAQKCAAPADVRLEGAVLNWKPVADAQSYELVGYPAFGGRSLVREATRETAFRLPPTDGAAYVMLRARCASAYSAPVYQVFASPAAR
jgi:hypothetical protein